MPTFSHYNNGFCEHLVNMHLFSWIYSCKIESQDGVKVCACWVPFVAHFLFTHWPFVCLLLRNVYLGPLLNFFIVLLLLLLLNCVSSVCIFWILTSYHIYGLQILPSISYLFTVDCFLCFARSYLVWCSLTCLFLLLLPLLLVSWLKKHHGQDQCQEVSFLCFILVVLQFQVLPLRL